jgi:hypothetical protein
MSKRDLMVFSIGIAWLVMFSGGLSGPHATLMPDEFVKPLPHVTESHPVGCIEVGEDCVPGEFLAILSKGKLIETVGIAEQKVQDFLKSIKTQAAKKNIQFLQPIAYALDDPSRIQPPSSPYDVCGQFLVQIRFMPKEKVKEAMDVVRDELLKRNQKDIINTSTLFGIQPDGFGRPQPVSKTSDLNPKLPFVDATKRINSGSLAGKTLPSVTVAVLDTGWTNTNSPASHSVNVDTNLDWDLTDLNVVRTLSSKPAAIDNFVEKSSSVPASEQIGHGTPVASIIGSQDSKIGVAPNARIIPIKICDGEGQCRASSAIYGVCYAMSKSVEASVINMSFAGRIKPDSNGEFHAPIFEYLINDADRNGSLIVTAGGNSRDQAYIDAHKKTGTPSPDNDPLYPSILSSGPNAKKATPTSPLPIGDMFLSIGAVFTNDEYAHYATSRLSIDLSAPGSWLRVIGKDGKIHIPDPTKPETNIEGTSYAAAYVSGAAALLIGKSGSKLTASKLAKKIVEQVNPNGCTKFDITLNDCGAGLLDVKKAWDNTP